MATNMATNNSSVLVIVVVVVVVFVDVVVGCRCRRRCCFREEYQGYSLERGTVFIPYLEEISFHLVNHFTYGKHSLAVLSVYHHSWHSKTNMGKRTCIL
ncbi:hypothetical protein J3F84DRAFT_354803 [Trichoderma pleuroticola]